nr:male accessory gland serine protease inhibitor-like [Drosophila virilis]
MPCLPAKSTLVYCSYKFSNLRMKLILYFLFLAVYVSSSSALKHEDCGLPHAKNGFDDGRYCLFLKKLWSYDTAVKKCSGFMYGGCGGNANRFLSQKDCEDKCLE